MSLYTQSKEVLYQDFLDKAFPSKQSNIGDVLSKTKLNSLKSVLEERIIIENFLETLSTDKMFTKSSENISEGFYKKTSLLLKLLPVTSIELFVADTNKREIFPVYSNNWDRSSEKKIILTKDALSQYRQIELLDQNRQQSFQKLLSRLTNKIWNSPKIFWFNYTGNHHLILVFETPYSQSYSDKVKKLLHSLLYKAYSPEMLNFSKESTERRTRKESFLRGARHFFNFQRNNDKENYIKRMLISFGYDASIILQKDDPVYPIYRISSEINFPYLLNTTSRVTIDDLLGGGEKAKILEMLLDESQSCEYHFKQTLFLSQEQTCVLLLQRPDNPLVERSNSDEVHELNFLGGLLRFAFYQK